MRLYSDFAQSDIVVASPLALATFLSETAGKDGGGADFLSSIEVAVVERADVLLMQNWAHVATGVLLELTTTSIVRSEPPAIRHKFKVE